MARISKKVRIIGLVAIAVIIVVAVAYFARDRFIAGDLAGAADSTAAAGDSTVAKSDDGDKKKDGEKKEAPPVPVEVAEAARRQISSYYVTTATLEPERKVDILAKVAGEVAKIMVEEGDFVKEGDLLCKLDDDELRISLEEATINQIQWKREFERIESMYKQNLISDKEYGDTKYQFELATNALEAASLRYEYTRIRSPFTGVVTERIVDEGENINVGSRLFVVADTEPLLITMFLPESELKTIQKGQTVYINPDVNPEMRFTGEIIRVAPEVDQRTGTVKVTAETRGGGIPGSFVRVKIVTDTRAAALTVPRRSVVADGGERFVFLAEADTVRKIEVAVGYEDEEYAEITDGIQQGDTVVVAGVGGVRTGTKVKILGLPKDDEEAVTDTVNN